MPTNGISYLVDKKLSSEPLVGCHRGALEKLMMHSHTSATLEQLEETEWFCAVGEHDTSAAVILSSWPEAITSCASVEWETLCLEAVNRYREQLAHRARERLNQWNSIVDEVKLMTVPLIKRKIERVVRENQLPQVFEDTVQWDILHVAMESEYADVYPPGFYASQAYWYVKGHFPCGWQGAFPEGTLVIY